MNDKNKLIVLFIISLAFYFLFFTLSISASVSCSSTCLTTAQVSQETTDYQNHVSGSKCLFIYNNQIYQPPTGSISNGMHKGQHACGADVTGIMKQSHINNPNSYLIPYVCAPLCSQPVCQDSDSDSYTASSCGGTDCNDNDVAIHPGATETCNNIDDNCNSQIDEGLSKQVSCGVGACQRTITQTCGAGSYGPSCVPGQSITEICGNSIDDDCEGVVENGCGSCTPGANQSCGSTIGACKAGSQTCSSTGTWGSCSGGVLPATEICGNSIDDNCDNQVDENCGSSTQNNNNNNNNNNQNSNNNSSQNFVFNSSFGSHCSPKCLVNCGQDNSCGGNCLDSDKNDISKCKNYSCIPICIGEMCGQDDSCGDKCPLNDKNTCGLCGNKVCCSPEDCENNIDDDCDGTINNGCDFQSTLINLISGKKDVSEINEAQNQGLSIYNLIVQPGFLARINGILAFFFASLSILIGLFRNYLINKFSRAKIIRFHTLLGVLALVFIILHIVFVLLDVSGWATSIKLANVFFLTFFESTLSNVSLGVIGMYLFLITVLTGFFYNKILKEVGYKGWLFLHRLSYVFCILVFFHALRMGTDFNNPYILIFFLQIIFIVGFVLIVNILQSFSYIRYVAEFIQKILKLRLSIKAILELNNIENKFIFTSGSIEKLDIKSKEGIFWFKLSDGFFNIQVFSKSEIEETSYRTIKAVVRYSQNKRYLEIVEVRK